MTWYLYISFDDLVLDVFGLVWKIEEIAYYADSISDTMYNVG